MSLLQYPYAWSWAFGLATFALLLRQISSRRNAARLPPGPKPWPIIGNALDVPRTDLGREWLAISQKYGDVVYLNALGQPMIVLGSLKAAVDLIEKRSANYSDRPTSIMANLTGFSEWLFVLMNYGSQWRRHRRTFHQIMNADIIHEYQGIQLNVARNLLRNIRQSPEDLGKHIEFAFASNVMRVIYGIELSEKNNKYFNMVKVISDIGEDITVPGRYLVEILPWLQYLPSWFPGGGFKKFAADAYKDMGAVVDELFANTKSALNRGDIKASAGTRLLSDLNIDDDVHPDESYEQMCKGVMATTYAAGAHTTNSAVRAFCLAMALFPEVQKKAQAEIDAVVGHSRLPDFSDRWALPYTCALLKEVMRWHVVTPIILPHRIVADDEYNGHILPGGAILVANAWAMSRDPAVYPDPEEFRPERFLDKEGRFDCQGRDPAEFAFGFGRRRCPGRHFSDANLFILCTSVLWAFSIKPPVDEQGVPREVNRKVATHVVIAQVEGADYTIELRSPKVDNLIFETTS